MDIYYCDKHDGGTYNTQRVFYALHSLPLDIFQTKQNQLEIHQAFEMWDKK